MTILLGELCKRDLLDTESFNIDGTYVRASRSVVGNRNVVKRRIGWLKESQSIGTRYCNLALNYLGFVVLGCIQDYLDCSNTLLNSYQTGPNSQFVCLLCSTNSTPSKTSSATSSQEPIQVK